jgi:guanine deaminase
MLKRFRQNGRFSGKQIAVSPPPLNSRAPRGKWLPPSLQYEGMSKTHEDWMRRAIALASENVHTNRGGPFGAVVVRNGEMIAEGANEVTATNDPTAHGEIVAIRRAAAALQSFSLAGCVLYTSAEPCPMCLAAIHWARMDGFFYGNSAEETARAGFDDALLYRELALPREARRLHGAPLLPAEALQSFALWQASGKRIDY